MEKNVGGMDRAGRLVVGLAVSIVGFAPLTGYLAVGAVVGAIALLVGLVLLATETTPRYPINETAGIDTTADAQ